MALVWLAALAAILLTALSPSRSAPPEAPQSAPRGAPAPQSAPPQSAPHGSAGCVGIPRSMPDRPIADAIAAVPILSTLASRISAAGLVTELNHRPHVTFFAPVNAALGNEAPLRLDGTVLRYHAVPERLTPDRLVGTHTTLQGGPLSVARGDSHVRVNASAGLICTRVEAANGSLYLIDALLTPPPR